MKIRMLVEVEIDNDAMAKTFGENLAMVIASGAVETKVGQVIGQTVSGLPHVKDTQVSVIPVALRSDKLA